MLQHFKSTYLNVSMQMNPFHMAYGIWIVVYYIDFETKTWSCYIVQFLEILKNIFRKVTQSKSIRKCALVITNLFIITRQ
jgi:hypothetical protein